MVSFNKILVLGLILAAVPAVKAMSNAKLALNSCLYKVTGLFSNTKNFCKEHSKVAKTVAAAGVTGATIAVLYKAFPKFCRLANNVSNKFGQAYRKVINSVNQSSDNGLVDKFKTLTKTQKLGVAATTMAVPVVGLGLLGYKLYCSKNK